MDYKKQLHKVVKEYFNPNKVISIQPYGGGLINSTFIVEFEDTRYILQKVNEYVFHSPIGVMYNIGLITNYIRKKVIYEGRNYRNATLTLIQTICGENFAIVDEAYWRCYTCIDGITYDSTNDLEIFYEAGKAVGQFQQLLEGFHTRLLSDNIKNFHNTPYRYDKFKESIKLDSHNRIRECYEEILFIHRREDKMDLITKALEEERIPKRVVHNDTKLNNIMFSKNGKHAMCLIDLDTVMKGSLVYDYGDALRLGASTAAEDEVDLSKVSIHLDLVGAFTKGFLEETKDIITKEEIALLFYGYYIITLELGMRFLTDYLDGDKYFALSEEQKKKRPKINLERARNQLKLVLEIEKNQIKLENIIDQTLIQLGYERNKDE